MALYRIDETGEAVRTDMEGYTEFVRQSTVEARTIARHYVVCIGGVVSAVTAARYHSGQILNEVHTAIRPNTEEYSPPWETWVEGEDEPRYRSSSREQALEAHKAVVNRKIKDHGGRVLIR